jgi:hypothetical protein
VISINHVVSVGLLRESLVRVFIPPMNHLHEYILLNFRLKAQIPTGRKKSCGRRRNDVQAGRQNNADFHRLSTGRDAGKGHCQLITSSASRKDNNACLFYGKK